MRRVIFSVKFNSLNFSCVTKRSLFHAHDLCSIYRHLMPTILHKLFHSYRIMFSYFALGFPKTRQIDLLYKLVCSQLLHQNTHTKLVILLPQWHWLLCPAFPKQIWATISKSNLRNDSKTRKKRKACVRLRSFSEKALSS